MSWKYTKQSLQTERGGQYQTCDYVVEFDMAKVRAMACKALANKSRRTRHGPMTIKIMKVHKD